MKNKFYIMLTASVLSIAQTGAHAACSASYNCSHPVGCPILLDATQSNKCFGYDTKYYVENDKVLGGITYCTKCIDGTEPVQLSLQLSTSCIANYTTCGCPDSCKTTAWTRGNTGYQQRTVCSLDTNCQARTEYRCASGYYGTSTNGTSGCNACPSSTVGLGQGEPQGYSSAGSTSITDCYIPQDIEICDSGGCFDTPDDCYYKN